jgi:hypothetical protein
MTTTEALNMEPLGMNLQHSLTIKFVLIKCICIMIGVNIHVTNNCDVGNFLIHQMF